MYQQILDFYKQRGYDEPRCVVLAERCEYYQSLGYTEAQSIVITMLDLNHKRQYEIDAILCAWENRPKEEARSFSEFVRSFPPVPEPEPAPVYTHDPTPVTAPKVGFFTRMKRKLSGRKVPGKGYYPVDREDGMTSFSKSAYSTAMLSPSMSSRKLPVVGSGSANVMYCMDSFDPEMGRTDSYESIEEKNASETVHSPASTFRPTFNTAAAGILFANLRMCQNVHHSMIRTEELLNYLLYELKKPTDEMFAFTTEEKQVNGKDYLFIGVQGKKVVPTQQNICFLLDVSGSMSSRSDQMVGVIFSVLAKMHDGDIFSLVTYSNTDTVVVNGLKLNKKADIDNLLYLIMKYVVISGYTNGSAGLNKAYEIVEANKITDGVNRVILMTDGDLNFGIHDKDGLHGLITKKRESGAYLSVIGTGIFNLQDDKLEVLAKNGNGNYFVVNDIMDVERSISWQYESLVFPIAKNVKAQVEFNPLLVKQYKLVGYENRMLSYEDFKDDTVIAEPFGSGSYFIALYEIERNQDGKVSSDLKYQTVQATNSDELATVTVRYEDADGSGFHEVSTAIPSTLSKTDNIEKAICCAELADKLRDEHPDLMSLKKMADLLLHG